MKKSDSEIGPEGVRRRVKNECRLSTPGVPRLTSDKHGFLVIRLLGALVIQLSILLAE